jgi:hypothetical protein
MGLAPVGSLIYGAVAHHLGPGLTIAGGSVAAGICAGAVLLKYPELRHLGFTQSEDDETAVLPPTLPPIRG